MDYKALAHDLRLSINPAEFMQSLGMQPDKWQREFLRSRDKRILLNCSRQSGKSTVTSILALHEAYYKPKSLILLLSPSLRQSLELYKKVVESYISLGHEAPGDQAKTTELKLANGSRIASLPGSEKTIRGYSGVNMLICDEAARIEDDLFYAVSPMLAVSGGRLILLSTPFGQRGVFHDQWTQGTGWQRFKIPADQCPRITPEFLENEKRTLPDRAYRQEYFCEFLQTDDALFSYEDIMSLVSDDIEPLFKEGI